MALLSPQYALAQPKPPSLDHSLTLTATNTSAITQPEAAQMAADRGVRIYVVGLGTPNGHAALGDGMAMYLQLDEPRLRHVAQMTGGEYRHAGTAEALRSVYLNLGSRMQVSKRETELTGLLAGAAAVLLLAGAGLSVVWFGRVA
jgi:Ca-activated chloride channel family protein